MYDNGTKSPKCRKASKSNPGGTKKAPKVKSPKSKMNKY